VATIVTPDHCKSGQPFVAQRLRHAFGDPIQPTVAVRRSLYVGMVEDEI